jgi:hypothetical protein
MKRRTGAYRSNGTRGRHPMTTRRGQFTTAGRPTYLATGRPVVSNGSHTTPEALLEVLHTRTVDVHNQTPHGRTKSETED